MNYLYLLLLTILCFACNDKTEWVHPQRQDITQSVFASGNVKSRGQYSVYSKMTATVDQVLVKDGEKVQKGQLLFKLSAEVPTLSTDNARIQADNADFVANKMRLDELDLAIEQSRRNAENAKRLWERQQKLWAENIGTKVELEQKELNYQNALSALSSAEIKKNDLKKQLHYADRQARKNLSISKSMLNDYEVKSELNGTVYAVYKEKGDLITPQSALGVIGTDDFYLSLQVDENDIASIQEKQKILVFMDSHKGQLIEGVITQISPIMNERSRSFTVEANFVNTPPKLYPNLSVEANIVLSKKQNAITIPRAYLNEDNTVWISKKEKKSVKTGLQDYTKVEILEGLSENDKIYKLP